MTRSGTNQVHGSVYYLTRNDSLSGTKAKSLTFNPGTYDNKNRGFWAGGPIQKNKIFAFFSYENEALTSPSTTFVANSGNDTVGGNTTRVLASDLDQLSQYLKTNFNYDTGTYQPIDFKTPSKRLLLKTDYNLNAHNKISFRYNQLDSSTDFLISNSSSLGNGSRRTSTNALSFNNSNYAQLENIKSGIGEWNSIIGSRWRIPSSSATRTRTRAGSRRARSSRSSTS